MKLFKTDDLRKKFLSRTLWCASSTHPGEEISLAKSQKT